MCQTGELGGRCVTSNRTCAQVTRLCCRVIWQLVVEFIAHFGLAAA